MASDNNTVGIPQKGRPPAVLQVVPSLVSGGVERGTVDLAAELVKAGWTAYVASAGGPMEHQLARAGARHFKLPLASKNPLVIRRNAAALIEIIRRHKIDIVHARSRAPAWSAWSAARATRRRFVTTFHNAYPADLPLKRWYNSIMARGERVIAISQFVGEHVENTYGIGSNRLRIIPRGVDLSVFSPSRVNGERIAELAAQWRVPDDVKIVMLPGRLTRWKGGLDFIEAIYRLNRRDLFCLLIGTEQRPGFRHELEAAIERLGLIGMFRIVDGCRDMPAAYCLSDVVVSASTDPEGFGRVIVEAQAMGRPVVATDHGGARETIIPGVTGWLAPPSDPDALSAAIREALALDGAELSAFTRRAMAHVAAEFTRELMCARTLDVYEELLFPETATAPTDNRHLMAIPA
ncbi:MAG TPA: glycosyltransferase family 4 protein [Stellaceae bacterium]|jgi:glycosyltransferase involved in cell wall biosynthesis|nr:glycosyltransferase family 4 protein [Stellaceae bacterium]